MRYSIKCEILRFPKLIFLLVQNCFPYFVFGLSSTAFLKLLGLQTDFRLLICKHLINFDWKMWTAKKNCGKTWSVYFIYLAILISGYFDMSCTISSIDELHIDSFFLHSDWNAMMNEKQIYNGRKKITIASVNGRRFKPHTLWGVRKH